MFGMNIRYKEVNAEIQKIAWRGGGGVHTHAN